MSWVWEQSTGTMYRPDGTVLGRGYAGHGSGINNPAMQAIPNVGPVPCGPNNTDGEYTIGPLLPNTEPGPLRHLGTNVAQLIPSDEQAAFIKLLGREPFSFYIHGGVAGEPAVPTEGMPVPSASEGCIVLGRDLRMAVLQSEDRKLIVRSGIA